MKPVKLSDRQALALEDILTWSSPGIGHYVNSSIHPHTLKSLYDSNLLSYDDNTGTVKITTHGINSLVYTELVECRANPTIIYSHMINYRRLFEEKDNA